MGEDTDKKEVRDPHLARILALIVAIYPFASAKGWAPALPEHGLILWLGAVVSLVIVSGGWRGKLLLSLAKEGFATWRILRGAPPSRDVLPPTLDATPLPDPRDPRELRRHLLQSILSKQEQRTS